MRKLEKGHDCSYDLALDVIVGKWKSAIIHGLWDEPLGTGQLRRAIPGISQRILTLQLKSLVADGVLDRTVLPTNPPRVLYGLTPIGESLKPVLLSLRDWGEDYARLMRSERIEDTPVTAAGPPVRRSGN